MRNSPAVSFRIFALAATLLSLLLSSRATAQSYPPVWTSSATYVAGDIVQYGGNWYRAMKALPAAGPYPASAYGSWELNYVRSNTTLTIGVGQGFASLVYAWTFAHNARIADAAYLHFSIVTSKGAFSESFANSFSLDHGSGADISIIGDNYDQISLKFSSSNGFVIDSGHSLGLLMNIFLTGSANCTGLSATSGASLASVTGLIVAGFGTCVSATQNASINIGGDAGFESFETAISADQDASVLVGPYLSIAGTGVSSSTGLYANRGGVINCALAVGVGPTIENEGRGMWAENGGIIYAYYARVHGCGTGLKADLGGHVFAENSIANTQNGSFAANGTDVKVFDGGVVDILGGDYTTSSIDSGTGSYIWGTAET